MNGPRKIALVSVARSDYGIYRALALQMSATAGVRLQLIAAAAHLSEAAGHTVDEIHADGISVAAQVPIGSGEEGREAAAQAIAEGIRGFSRAFLELRPDIVTVLGDRFEMYAAAVAAYSLGLPLAHIHGGELTFGAMDEGFRHSVTKLSHLHFPSTEEYARRIVQMGEEPWRVTVAGALALNGLAEIEPATRAEIERFTRLRLDRNPLLVTFHPATLDETPPGTQVEELLAALEEFSLPILFTLPNTDPGASRIREAVERFVAAHPRSRLVANLGVRLYASMMHHAAAMVGNSSSGIIEAPSFGLPVVNIGTRQDGRVRGANVIDCRVERSSIRAAIERALTPEFRRQARQASNPYYRPASASIILDRLRSQPLDQRLLCKQFYDVQFPLDRWTLTGSSAAVNA